MMKSKDSNLHSMVLRPKEKDSFLRFVNPVFSLERTGTSVLYEALSHAFDEVKALPGVRELLVASVLETPEGKSNDFAGLQRVLSKKILKRLKIPVDFNLSNAGIPVTQESIDILLGCNASSSATANDYIEGLLGVCAPVLFDTLTDSPFYTRQNGEELSIFTQFFLASVNIHCHINKISALNFGAVLDCSEDLSEALAAMVLSINNGDSIEDALLDFVNKHSKDFGLAKPLTSVDRAEIKKKFQNHVSEIKKSPHFDEFILLDASKPGPFISHQGSICLNLVEFMQASLPELTSEYFESIRTDFKALNGDIESINSWIHASVELSMETLLAKITDEMQLEAVLKKLEPKLCAEILASPKIKRLQVPKFLRHVARGEQNEAESLLKANPDAQFLLQSESFTDYSGRTFNCTAYEYAYWAKDTHMCRMLENQMDDTTKAEMLKRCDAIERDGLTYSQNGEVLNSKHYDLTLLITALQEFIHGFDDWQKNKKWGAIEEAWLKIGIAQRDVPAHVAHEYCRPDRSFSPLPEFNEPTLPRSLTFFNWPTERVEPWFPLDISDRYVLGRNLALYRQWPRLAEGMVASSMGVRFGEAAALVKANDLPAVSRLDEVRTNDLTHLRDALRPSEAPRSGNAIS